MVVKWHKYTAKCSFILRLNIEHDIISLTFTYTLARRAAKKPT